MLAFWSKLECLSLSDFLASWYKHIFCSCISFCSKLVCLWSAYFSCSLMDRHHDTQHNATKHNATKPLSIMTLSITIRKYDARITTFVDYAECHYTKCWLCWVTQLSSLYWVLLCWVSFPKMLWHQIEQDFLYQFIIQLEWHLFEEPKLTCSN